MIAVRTITLPPPPVSRKEILRYACAKEDASLDSLLDACIAEALPHLTYRVAYALFPIERVGNTLDLGFMQSSSRGLFDCLCGFDRVLVFGATVGHAYDRLLRKSAALSSAKALILEAFGAERAEALTHAFCTRVAEKCRAEGGHAGARFSPGYGDLPLSVQRDIFRALSLSRNIGLSLNESLLMSPKKSVTAFFGVCGGGDIDIGLTVSQ